MRGGNSQIRRFQDSWLARAFEEWDPVLQLFRVRLAVPSVVTGVAVQQVFRHGKSVPWALLGLGWGSNRANDDRWVSLQITSPDFTLLGDPALLSAWGGGGPGGSLPLPVPPTVIGPQVELRISALRETAVDPAEPYPGAGVASQIDLLLWGLALQGPYPSCQPE